MLKTMRISEASWRVTEEHSKDLKVWREELRTIAGSRMRKAEPPPEICADLEEGVIRWMLKRSNRGAWNKKYTWASVEEIDILVSCKARSGGREQEARSVKAVEFMVFNMDRIFREYPVSTGILPHSLPEWAFRARPGLWRICLCPKVARIAEQKFGHR